MVTRIVPIGNSKGVRIPATVLKQCDIADQVELEIVNNEIVIKPLRKTPRDGWAKSFMKMHEQGDDRLLIDDALEMEAWEWK